MGDAAKPRATRQDLDALPAHLVGELIGGTLYTMTRPRPRQARAASILGGDLGGAYDRGRGGGPGGWWIMVEPGVELPEHDVVEIVPDVAGWTRKRLPRLPEEGAITVVPDWVCEVLSPRTRHHDLKLKRPRYADFGVPHMWLVDVEARVLSASRLQDGSWLEVGVWGDADRARIPPFEAVELDLAELWADPDR
jgi:Uma2 family endonuclease